jgi:hypothetical protein
MTRGIPHSFSATGLTTPMDPSARRREFAIGGVASDEIR